MVALSTNSSSASTFSSSDGGGGGGSGGGSSAPPPEIFLSERLSFPQIWVESVCESSEEEEEEGSDQHLKDIKGGGLFSVHLTGARPKDKVIRSLVATCSSNDVSFESNSTSSRQNSFREDSVDLDCYGGYMTPALDLCDDVDDVEGNQAGEEAEEGEQKTGCEATARRCEGRRKEEEEEEARKVCSSAGEGWEERTRATTGSQGFSLVVAEKCEAVASIGKEEEEKEAHPATGESSSPSCQQPLFGDSPPTPDVFEPPVALVISSWLEQLQSRGFCDDAVRSFAREEIDYDEEDDTWFQQGLVRVFDPYYDIDPDDIQEVDGRVDKLTKLPIGLCTVKLKSGDELLGTFRSGVRQGRGSIEGVNLLAHGLICVRGSYRDGVLLGPGSAVLAEGGMWGAVEGRITLEGVFNDGYLEGPVKGTDDSGALVFAGQYRKGLPVETCWLAKEGQGWLCGRVDEKGRFSGEEIAFLYPDKFTGLIGSFREEVMLDALAGRVAAADLNDAHILCLAMKSVHPADLPSYSHAPSDAKGVHCRWDVPDCYESATVECRSSSVCGAGDGLFALRELPEGRVVSFYNGVCVRPGESYSTDNLDYQIYVDWTDTDRSAFMDVPRACADVSSYRASLAHKANHSFRPNCCYVAVDHPRFGRIPALKTLRLVSRDEELFAHYKYDMALAPEWYQRAWERQQREDGYGDEDEVGEVEEDGLKLNSPQIPTGN